MRQDNRAPFIFQKVTFTNAWVCVFGVIAPNRAGQKSHLDGMEEKYYVVGLDPETNSVIVARGSSNPTLYARGLSCLSSEFHWVAGVPPIDLIPAKSTVGYIEDPGTGLAVESSATGAREASTIFRCMKGHGGYSGRSEQQRGHFRCTYRFRHRQELRPCTVELWASSDVESSPGAFFNDEATEGGRELRETKCGNNVTDGFPQKELFCVGTGDFVSPSSDVVGDYISDDRAVSGVTSEGALSSALVVLHFDDPAKAVTPGQVVALYRDGVCLGGGPILRAEGHCSPVVVRPSLSSPSKLRGGRQ